MTLWRILLLFAVSLFFYWPIGVSVSAQVLGEEKVDGIYFESPDHGFVRQDIEGQLDVLETKDGGRTWRRLLNGGFGPRFRRGRVFVSPLKGWSIVEDCWPHRRIYFTQDGGRTWRLSYAAIGRVEPILFGIQVVSESEIWVVGTESFHTTDGGRNWERVPIGGLSVHFVDREHGWSLDGGFLWKTADAGKTWRKIPLMLVAPGVKERGGPWDIYFIDEDHGWIVTGERENDARDGAKEASIFYTSDGGETWREIARLKDHFLWAVFFLSDKVGWVGGTEGSFLETTDGGKTWFVPATKKHGGSVKSSQ